MNDSSNWSLHLGRWRRAHIRVHALFVAVAIFALFLSTSGARQESIGYGFLAVAILFFSVLAHELGHVYTALRVGGSLERIVIGPLGGLSHAEVPREPQGELIAALAGPVVNLAIVILVLPILLAAGADVPGLLNPLQPADFLGGEWYLVALRMTFWINWILVVVNILPAYPFDGARVLRILLWPALDYRAAAQVAVTTSKVTAAGLCVLAVFLSDMKSAEVLPCWVPLVLLAAFVFFNAQYAGSKLDESEWDEDLFSYDFSQGYTSLERRADPPRRTVGSVRRWLEGRREMRRRRRRWQELEEERQVDEILLRLHETGMDRLSAKERALLNRVSARYRNRSRS